jgi:hypothetical protein
MNTSAIKPTIAKSDTYHLLLCKRLLMKLPHIVFHMHKQRLENKNSELGKQQRIGFFVP